MPVQCTCVGCGRAFLVPPSNAHRKWCSAACRYSTPGWTDVLHPGGRQNCVCAICGAAFTTVASRIGRYCSRKCLGIANGQRQHRDSSKWRTYTCVECSRTFTALVCVGYRKRYCSRTCRALFNNRGRHILRPTSIEIALGAALLAAGIAVEREYPVGRFSLDFAVPSQLLAIEADGDYWHSLPKQQIRDAKKDAYLLAAGWALLRFTETQIIANAGACAAIVAATLRRLNPPTG